MQNNNLPRSDFHIDQIVKLPCVSVIVVNYNYSRFICDAIRSVVQQSYPRVETIVVDDVSTDDSIRLVKELISSDEAFGDVKLHEMHINSGQMAAMRRGIEESTGEYIIFLDADDILLPKFVETHIYCHLSSTTAVGFSSVDMLTVVNGSRVATTTSPAFSEYVTKQRGQVNLRFRPFDHAYPESWFGGRQAPVEADQVHVALPPQCEWIWSPTSGNCFRRDALKLFEQNDDVTKSRVLPDAYFMKGIASICGSMLIDKPLMGYRVHGFNAFADSAPLLHLRAYDISKHSNDLFQVSNSAVMHLIKNADSLSLRLTSNECYFQALKGLSDTFPLNEREDYLDKILQSHNSSLSKAFGPRVLEDWLSRRERESEEQQAFDQSGGLFRFLGSIRERAKALIGGG